MLSIWWCDNTNPMISDYLGKFPELHFSRWTGHYVVIKQLLSWYPASAECIVAGLAKLSYDKYHSSNRYTRSTTYHGPAWSLGYFSDEASCSARSWAEPRRTRLHLVPLNDSAGCDKHVSLQYQAVDLGTWCRLSHDGQHFQPVTPIVKL